MVSNLPGTQNDALNMSRQLNSNYVQSIPKLPENRNEKQGGINSYKIKFVKYFAGLKF